MEKNDQLITKNKTKKRPASRDESMTPACAFLDESVSGYRQHTMRKGSHTGVSRML